MTSRDNYSGIDPKSIAINVFSIALICLPVACYVYQDHILQLVAFVVALFGIALIVPPWGWKRPHPYSDMADNVPMGYNSPKGKKAS